MIHNRSSYLVDYSVHFVDICVTFELHLNDKLILLITQVCVIFRGPQGRLVLSIPMVCLTCSI